MKHLRELVLTVSSVGVDDDEVLGLKLLVVGEACLEVDLSMLEVDDLVVSVGVVEAWSKVLLLQDYQNSLHR